MLGAVTQKLHISRKQPHFSLLLGLDLEWLWVFELCNFHGLRTVAHCLIIWFLSS